MNAIFVVGVLRAMLTLLAGPYRAVAFKFGSFGGMGLGSVTWLGILVVFPAYLGVFPPDWPRPGVLWLWAALVVCAYMQMMVPWCIPAPRRDDCSPHCWAGGWEPLLAYALYAVAAAASDPVGGTYFLIGYASSLAEWRLSRLQRRLETWTDGDRERLLAAVGGAAAPVTRALPPCGRVIQRTVLLLASVTAAVLGWVWRFLTGRRQPSPAAGPYYAPPPSLAGRALSAIAWHMAISTVSGVLGFNILAIPFAIFLALMGWRVGLPEKLKEDVRGVVSNVKELVADKKEEVLERMRVKKDERKERFAEQEQKIRDEMSRRKRQAILNYATQHPR